LQAAFSLELLWMASKLDSQRVDRCYLAGMSVCPPYLHQSSTMEEVVGVCVHRYGKKFLIMPSATVIK